MKAQSKGAAVSVSADFSDTPGGARSGERFLESVLAPAYADAIARGVPLTVDLDGGFGYRPSFLAAAFGGLALIYGAESVARNLRIISEDEPSAIGEIISYIRSATGARK